MRALAATACLLLAGCGSLLTRRPPVAAQVDASCFQAVVDSVRWTGDPNDPATWDILGGEVVPALRAEVATADAHRLACEQALRRLDKAKVIDLGR